MRHLLFCAAALVLPGTALGQSPAPSPKPSTKPASPAPSHAPAQATASTKPASPAPGAAAAATERHSMVGTIVSVDAAKSTLTFKDSKGQTLTWKAEGKAAGRLKGLKAGQKIKIGYSVDDKGAPKAATTIRFVGKGKKSEAM